jgi:YbbR domain-containing protein
MFPRPVPGINTSSCQTRFSVKDEQASITFYEEKEAQFPVQVSSGSYKNISSRFSPQHQIFEQNKDYH